MKTRILGLVAVGLLAGPSISSATIFLSGDSNIGNALDGSSDAPLNPANGIWFRNVLGGGTTVKIQFTPVASIYESANAVNNFYNALGGVSSSFFWDFITAEDLSGVDLFFSFFPQVAYSGTEVAALQSFLSGGGTLFLLGDNNSCCRTVNGYINQLLSSLGSGMSLGSDSLDSDFQTTLNIDADPLNAGVSSFTYAFTSSVSGGASLIRTLNGTTFIAYESVPEPASLALLGLGLAGLGLSRRRRA